MKCHSINRFKAALFCIASFMLLSLTTVGQIPPKPEIPYAINDYASVFSNAQKQDLENRLVSFSAKTSNRIVVVTVNDLGGYEPSEFAYTLGEKWGVGSGKFDNGIVILIKPKTGDSGGKVFIAVGYGLEGVLPDAAAKRIIETEMIPHFKENNYYAAVDAALKVLFPIVSGEITYDEWAGSSGSDGFSIAYILVVIFLILSFILRKKGGNGNNGGNGKRGLSPLDAFVIGSALGHSGRGFGGGGFGSGGGFGGGGFSGGFGGGSFGGGGAGGSW